MLSCLTSNDSLARWLTGDQVVYLGIVVKGLAGGHKNFILLEMSDIWIEESLIEVGLSESFSWFVER